MKKTFLRLSAAVLLVMCHMAVAMAQGGKEIRFGFDEGVTKTDDATGTIGAFETVCTSEIITTEWITDGLRSIATDANTSWTYGGVAYTGQDGVQITFNPSPTQGYYGYKVTIPEGYSYILKSVKGDVLMTWQQLSQQIKVETAEGSLVWKSDSNYVRKGAWRNTINTTLTDNVELSAGTYLFKSVVSLTEGGGGKLHTPVALMFTGELKYAGGSMVVPQLTSLTADGIDLLAKVSDNTVNYQLAYGACTFPEVKATCDENGTVTVTQATVDYPQAKVKIVSTDGYYNEVYTVKFTVGQPATAADTIYVATPVINVVEGENSDVVTITTTTPNAKIYYTIDGSTPTTKSILYTGELTVNHNMTLSAIAMLPVFNYGNSSVATHTFTHFKTIGGFSFTLTTGDGTTTDLTSDDSYKYIRQSKSNPSFGLKGSSYVYSDSRFKIGAGQKFAISVPANAVVSKVTFNSFCENYYDAATDNYALMDYFRSEGATCIYSDTIRGGKDTEFIVQNHSHGKDIEFSIASCRQVAFGSVTIEYSQYNDGQVNLLSTSIADKAITDASACLTMYFDRSVTLADNAKMKLDGTDVRTVANDSKVRAYYWNLPYGSTHTLTLAANSLKDIFGNCYGKDITVSFTVKEAPKTQKATFDYVVGTPEELKAALTAVAATNTTADAARKRILVKNGDYDMGQQTETKINGYNVSLIGQSREGVRIFHEGNGGIVGDATLCNNSQDFYMQDITVEHASSVRKGNSRGVTVAYCGGNKAILKNVEMISGQDTYVTGDRTYHEDCIIHGTVDFICGGGDNYFYRTDLLIEGGACITAASHDASTEWGYVFRDCTVKPGNFITPAATNGSYTLGRPWKNEPRVAFINTQMNITASEKGWGGMSLVNTHFYEYGSKDANGKDVSLAKRTVKDISLNQYTPVLTKEQADDYDMYNVVGGDDGWIPTLYTKQMEAPVVNAEGNTISWNEVDNALCYVVFCDGKYVGQTTDTSFACTDNGNYTVCAANEMGGLGAPSVGVATGIGHVEGDKAEKTKQVYDLGGRKQDASKLAKGIYIVNGKKQICK